MGSLRDTPLAQSSCKCVNVANFVSTKLRHDEESNNYKSWKEQMLCLIESEGLLDFIDGNISPSAPGEKTSDDYVAWRRTDRQVKGWILGSLSDEVAEIVVSFDTARDVWFELERTFTQAEGSSAPPSPPAEQESDRKDYLPVRLLYRASLKGDWDEAKRIIEQDPTTAYTLFAYTLETPLHIAVGTGKAIHFVQNLVPILTDDQLALKSRIGFNALHVAALAGNTAAARILVARLPELLYMPSNTGNFPVNIAAIYGQRDTLEFLISQTKDDGDPNPYAGEIGAILLMSAINADFLDIAINLADKYPQMATTKTKKGYSALRVIAFKELAFYSGTRFNFWERLIYRGSNIVPIHRATATPNWGDIEDPTCTSLLHCGKYLHFS